ncbi:rhomboid family intramembrane serine protease [Ferdinandcohnia quinoae]|uniref:Rhomboid family intramembrane serine protease n=1 Tax=Fredinandcohnia quinoae TaxID=2918902 RepID=A0AAW5E017_9BACI|nr:rhomboid family intramembrane serine protease [Fredinandcohnia sp. SECRCQ15]MCH1624929.1 rhomboid family intramembrane serine protease [Fredinandcohnia sp. SECRCQ15]
MFKQDFTYWKMIHSLLVNGDYRILQISQSNNEIWLESTQKNKPRIIRLLRYDLDWSNWMQRDMEITAAKVEKLRQKLFLRKIEALNIYISTYSPVDDWHFRVENPLQTGKKQQTSLQSIVITSEDEEQGLALFAEKVQILLEIEDDGSLIDEAKIEILKRETITIANQRAKADQKLFQNGKPFFTYLLIAIQVIMFGILELNGGSTSTNTLIKYGAKENLLILDGEWWRFFSPMFLHIGFFHLLMNTVALYYLGTAIERIFGKPRFLLIYIFAGFSGSLASFVFSPALSAGASGAIFGCFGALLFFGMTYPSLFFRTMGANVIGVIIFNLIFGFVVPGIDNAGHIGGLIGGFLATSIIQLPNHQQYVKRAVGLIVTVTLLLSMFYIGYEIQPQSNNPQFVLKKAQKEVEANNFEEAYQLLHNIVDEGEPSAELYFYLSVAEIKLGKFEQAKEHLIIVTNEEPTLSEAHYNLALVYIQLQDYKSAKESAENAASANPDNESYKKLIKELEEVIGSTD